MRTRKARTWNDAISEACDAYAAGDDSALDKALQLVEAAGEQADEPIVPDVPDRHGPLTFMSPPIGCYMNIEQARARFLAAVERGDPPVILP